MSKDKNFGDRVWRGDKTTVAEAEEKYKRDPERQLLPYASVLYSFRGSSTNAHELEQLRNELKERARGLILTSGMSSDPQGTGDKMDMLATYLSWLSRRQTFTFPERLSLRKLAWEVASSGYMAAAKVSQSFQKHTPLLLLLTQAELLIGEKLYALAKELLDGVSKAAVQASDLNQRARIYRKLGMLYRKLGWYYGMPSRIWYGIYLGMRAIFVRGVPVNNRLKSVAGLFHIGR